MSDLSTNVCVRGPGGSLVPTSALFADGHDPTHILSYDSIGQFIQENILDGLIVILMSRCGQVGVQLHDDFAESREQWGSRGVILALYHAITFAADRFELRHIYQLQKDLLLLGVPLAAGFRTWFGVFSTSRTGKGNEARPEISRQTVMEGIHWTDKCVAWPFHASGLAHVWFPVSYVILRVREHYNALSMPPFFIDEKIPCMAMVHGFCTAVQRVATLHACI
jgi:hypothetical protein